MPSGSKKRKAAKKKKENQPNTLPSPSSQSQGGEDVKHQDDKDSDVGEGNSPISQDSHGHENLLNEGEEEGKNSSVEGVKIEVVDDANIGSKEVAFDSVEREFRIGEGSNEQDERFEHGGRSRSSSSSSSGSSDDESHGVDSSQVEEVTAVGFDVSCWKKDAGSNTVTIEETSYSTVESIPVVGSEDISSTSYKITTVEDQRSSGEDKVGASTASEETALEQKEDAIITSVEAVAVKEGVTHTIETDVNGANRENGSRVTENVLAPAPHPVHTTSWKNCCGLFEVFTGSGR